MSRNDFERHHPLRKPPVWGGKGSVERCIAQKDIAAVRGAIAEGIDVNERDEHGQTLLMIGASVASAEIVEILLLAGGDPNLVNDDSQGPLTNAVRNVRASKMWRRPAIDRQIVSILIKAGANPDQRDAYGRSPAERISQSFSLRRLFKKHGYTGNFSVDEPHDGS